MHLTEMIVQAGVDSYYAGDEDFDISSVSDHHTLKRLGYRRHIATWSYVGRGKVNTDQAAAAPREHDEDTEEEEAEEPETTAQAESAAPSQPPPPRPHARSAYFTSHVSSEIVHLRKFMVEQLHFMQATIMSKLESIDSRLQACEAHLGITSRTSPIPPPSLDPKGKAPMVSSITSPTASPIHSPTSSPHIHSPLASPQESPPHDPIIVPSHSSSSSSFTSSESTSQQYELTARTPASPHSSTVDSEATPSPPPPPSQ